MSLARQTLLAVCSAVAVIALGSPCWIGAPGNGSPAFEKTFEMPSDTVQAELVISAPGFYEAYLDGVKIGDRVLDPSPTDFSKRVLSVRLPMDVKPGMRTLRILLGHGWYDQRAVSAWNNHEDRWRAEPCVRAEIVLWRKSGESVRIGTDRTWRQVASPVVWDDLREGEIVDPGFVLPRKGMGEFASEVKGPSGRIVPMAHPPARVVRTFLPKKTWKVADGWMMDFGINLSGWTRMKFRGGLRGQIATIRYDERIGPNGEPTVRVERKDVPRRNRMELWPGHARVIDCYVFSVGSTNILAQGDMQQDRFVMSGKPEEIYEPRFTYHGFRYVYLRGVSEPPETVACEIRTDFPVIGTFHCSNRDLNDLMRMADQSYRSNFTDGVPTDCPHREKNGWTGDAQIACEYAQYAYENTDAYLKWIEDLVDAQYPDGGLPGVVPSGGWGFDGEGYGPVWDSAMAFVPWYIYVYRDDDRGLRIARTALGRNIAFHLAHLDSDGLSERGLGDWITCGHYTDQRYCGSAYLYGMLTIAAGIESLLGCAEKGQSFQKRAEKLKGDFNRRYYKGDGLYADGYQTQQALAITFELYPDGEREAVGKRLVEAVHAANGHIDFGLVGSKHVFRALSEIGRTDLALRMLLQKTKPSMLQWRDAGGTTLWEDWETGFSRNHVMFGDFACWAYQYLAGLRLPPGGSPAVPNPPVRGFKAFENRPYSDCLLEWANATITTKHGIASTENQ